MIPITPMIYWYYSFTTAHFLARVAESKLWYWSNFDQDATHMLIHPDDYANNDGLDLTIKVDPYVKPGTCLIGRESA
jgi:hypothetical protein